MSRLLSESTPGSCAVPVGAASWSIDGAVYDNSAVKFWSGLLDEVTEDFPGANGLIVEGPCDDLLVPDLLNPVGLFEDELADLEDDDDIDGTMGELAQELELIGPPLPVRATVLDDAKILYTRELPDEVIDSELLPIFLVWPLEWAGLSEFGWNRRQVSGRFTARDETRGLTYTVRFALDNRHVREGLFHRKMTVQFDRASANTR